MYPICVAAWDLLTRGALSGFAGGQFGQPRYHLLRHAPPPPQPPALTRPSWVLYVKGYFPTTPNMDWTFSVTLQAFHSSWESVVLCCWKTLGVCQETIRFLTPSLDMDPPCLLSALREAGRTVVCMQSVTFSPLPIFALEERGWEM
jgi:hypothetical protein